MDRDTAGRLYYSFRKHLAKGGYGFDPSREVFLDLLEEQGLPTPKNPVLELPLTTQSETLGEQNSRSILLRKIVNAPWFFGISTAANISFFRSMYEGVLGKFFYSPDLKLETLRMRKNLFPGIDKDLSFFLLGEDIELYSGNNEDGDVLYSKTRPILVIPGLEGDPEVLRWEKDKIHHGRRVPLISLAFSLGKIRKYNEMVSSEKARKYFEGSL